jgi:hypothetical protein
LDRCFGQSEIRLVVGKVDIKIADFRFEHSPIYRFPYYPLAKIS